MGKKIEAFISLKKRSQGNISEHYLVIDYAATGKVNVPITPAQFEYYRGVFSFQHTNKITEPTPLIEEYLYTDL